MIRLLGCSSIVALVMTGAPAVAAAQETLQQNQPDRTADRAGQAQTPSSAQTQDQSASVNAGEIIVTARKREETLRDVPTTITAVTAGQLEAKGPVTGTGDLLQTVPGVRFNGLQSENLAEVSIRGSGTERATSADSGVGLFVNGAYVGSSTLGGRNFKRIDYFDVARAEVLEGPQGALYGRNSEFGTVNLVLAQPEFKDAGRISGTYTAETEQTQLEAVVNQKLSDTVAIRIGGQVTGQTGGFYFNPKQNSYYDRTNGFLARGQIRYNSGPLDVTLLVDAQDMDLPTFINQLVIPPNALPALPLGYIGPRYSLTHEGMDGVTQKVQRAMLIGKYDLGWGDLTSTSMILHTTSAQQFSSEVNLETQAMFQQLGEIGIYPLGQTTTFAEDKTYYQDLHLAGDASGGRLSWLAGVEGIIQNDHYVRTVAANPCPLTLNAGICGGTPTTPVCYLLSANSTPCPTPFPGVFGTALESPAKYRSEAIYGSLKYEIGQLTLSGELRYSHDWKQATQTNTYKYSDTLVAPSTTFAFSQSNLSYSATASYKLATALPVLVYAKTGSGYRAGGVNNGIFNPNAPNPLKTTYGNETTTSYEVGIKANVSRAIFLRLSAYTSTTKNAIASILDGCTITNACQQGGTYFNVNGGNVRSRGIEGSIDANINVGTGKLAISINGARQSGKFVYVPTDVTGLPILDSTVAQIPEWTMSANVNFRQPISTDVTGLFNVTYNGQRGGGQDNVTIATPFIPLEDVNNIDMRVGVKFKRIELAVFAKNLTNEIYPVLKLQAGTIPLVNRYNQPRTIGVNVVYRW